MEYQKNKYYEIAIVSDIGERKENEDAYGIDVSEENAAVVVCDGMGGFESGKLASGIAVNDLIRLYRQRINQKKIDEDFLVYAMDSVDIRISNLHNEDGKKIHAGSTCVMLALQKRGMYCLSVGDSRGTTGAHNTDKLAFFHFKTYFIKGFCNISFAAIILFNID